MLDLTDSQFDLLSMSLILHFNVRKTYWTNKKLVDIRKVLYPLPMSFGVGSWSNRPPSADVPNGQPVMTD